MAKVKGFFSAIGSWFVKVLRPVGGFFKKVFRPVTNLFIKLSDWFKDNVSYRKRQAIWGIVFILPLMIGFIYFFLIPFINTVIFSFSFVDSTGGFTTRWVGLENYQYIFLEEPTFLETLVASILGIALD